MNLGTAQIIRADARNLPLPDASVDVVCTSPPFFALRSYQDGGEHYEGQLGSEATPAEFVDALIECTREMVRVLKPSGSIFVNLGDKYASGDGSGSQRGLEGGEAANRSRGHARIARQFGTRPKSLLGIPWRYALRCIDDLGLILRAEIIWSKPNGLPESVTDRVRRSHETWFHMVKMPRYYSAVDEIREATTREGLTWEQRKAGAGHEKNPDTGHNYGGPGMAAHSVGKLPGSVRTVPTSPLTVPAHLGIDHFAAFPPAWPEWIIRGWSPSGVCTVCGEGRRPVSERTITGDRGGRKFNVLDSPERGVNTQRLGTEGVHIITGYACACPPPPAIVRTTSGHWAHYATCPTLDGKVTRPAAPNDVVQCHRCPRPPAPAPTTPATILDPFGGTGTTALVAKALGRDGISVDLSGDYSRLARWRTTDPGELARVLGVEKPAPQVEGQWDLFGGEAS